MPIYEYKCKRCRRVTELWKKVEERPDRIRCQCGTMAKQVLSRFVGHTDGDVSWLDSAKKVLQPDGERPIETRGDYKKYLKSHNLVCIG